MNLLEILLLRLFCGLPTQGFESAGNRSRLAEGEGVSLTRDRCQEWRRGVCEAAGDRGARVSTSLKPSTVDGRDWAARRGVASECC